MHYLLIRQVFLVLLLLTSYVPLISIASPKQSDISDLTDDSADTFQHIEQINSHINSKFRYLTDRDDHWLTLDEFMAQGGGDCEDFALAKYQLLLESGLPKEDFRFAYTRLVASGEHHIALIHLPSSKLLDSLTSDTRSLNQRNDLLEEFRFSGIHFAPARQKKLSRTQLKTLQRWQSVIRKAESAAITIKANNYKRIMQQ